MIKNTCAHSCCTRVQYGSVSAHIVGSNHCKRVAKNLQKKQDADSVEGDEAVDSDETTGQAKNLALLDFDRMPQDAADGGGKSATKRKTSKKTADGDDDDDEGSQNALTEQGGMVVNGFDIVKYIRGLERRVSELEKKVGCGDFN